MIFVTDHNGERSAGRTPLKDTGQNFRFVGFVALSGDSRLTGAAALGRGAEAVCPVTAADLMPGLSGKALGERLKEIEAEWIASGFTATREALL